MAETTTVSIRDRIASLQIDQVKMPVKRPPPLPYRPTRAVTAKGDLQTSNNQSDNLPNGIEHPPAPLLLTGPKPSLPPRLPSGKSPSVIIPTPSSQVKSSPRSVSVNSTVPTSVTYSILNPPILRKTSLDAPLSKEPSLPPRKQSDLYGTAQSQAVPGVSQNPRQTYTKNASSAETTQKSVLLMGFDRTKTPAIPSKPITNPCLQTQQQIPQPLPQKAQDIQQPQSQSPPPIPLHSKPKLPKTVSDNITVTVNPPQSNGFSATYQSVYPQPKSSCLICRDFSAPDNHAARFPRQAIPSTDPAWLSFELTSPFVSSTDKARAIFTWLHHNIAYDTVSFFSKTCIPATASGVITSGLAVCEGYAILFNTLAMHAGLNSVVISGASKGFGFKAVQPGEPIPEFKMTHAWNAIKIDNGEWKLIDACWGAGALGSDNCFRKGFDPKWFTMSNNDFGQRHYPTDAGMMFRTDGRPFPYEEYIIGDDGPGDNLTVYKDCITECGLSDAQILPKKKLINVRGRNEVVRFQFQKLCEHWDNARHGKGRPYVLVLLVQGVDGRKQDYLPFNTNGSFWWVDAPVRELGAPGQTVSAFRVKTLGPRDGRGVSVAEYKAAKGKQGMSFGGVAMWELV